MIRDTDPFGSTQTIFDSQRVYILNPNSSGVSARGEKESNQEKRHKRKFRHH